MFKTSGWLVWQLNDCWPVVSWSLIDYGLTPKAAYYTVKRASKPVIAPLIVKNGQVQGFVINETAKELEATWKFEVVRFSGAVLNSESQKIKAPAFTSTPIFDLALEKLPTAKDSLLTLTLESGGKLIAEDTKTVNDPKNLQLPQPKIKLTTKKTDDKTFEIQLQTEVYAKAVYLQMKGLKAEFSDNFFDLMPKSLKSVQCSFDKTVSHEEFERALLIETYPYE